VNGATTEMPAAIEVDGLPLVLPRHLIVRFEEAEAQLQATYGIAPGVRTLVRLWLACGSVAQVRREFEMAVLGITKPVFEFENEGDSDGDDDV
jgi:hypothetical protein